MSGYWMVLEAPTLNRRCLVNEMPTSLIDARRVLYSFAARLETTTTVTDLELDYHISNTGALCEGLRWRVVECDGAQDCAMNAYLTDDPDSDLLLEGFENGSMDH